MDVKIRYALPEEIEQISELYEQLMLFHMEEIQAYSREDMANEIESVYTYIKDAISAHNLLVAIDENQIIGFCIFENKSAIDEVVLKNKSLLINELYIKEGYRRKGIGSKLLEEANKIRQERGLTKLELIAYTNNISALEFYEKMGFKCTAIVLEKDFRNSNNLLPEQIDCKIKYTNLKS